MLVEAADIEWHEVEVSSAKLAASKTGDLARLSDVDLEVLALALKLQAKLVSDDYRLQNICKSEGLQYESIQTKGARDKWSWELRCTGCKKISPVPEDVQRSKKDAAAECDVCGSPMLIKRAKR